MLPDSPKLINATVPGTGDAGVGGQITFQNTVAPGSGKRIHNDCRTSVLIVNSVIFVGFAHNSDSYPYHGWVFSYQYNTNANKFDQLAYFCVTPNAGLGGVWQGGQGIASDGKYIYFTTGNGDFNSSKNSWSMAVIKMTLQLSIVDYFVAADWKKFSDGDLDLGGCGPTLIPNTHFLIVGVTKYGHVHLIDTANLGKFTSPNDACTQTVDLVTRYVPPGGNPVAWDMGGGKGAKIYSWGTGLQLVQFHYNPSTERLDVPWVNWGGSTSGGGLLVSSNGNENAVLWAYSADGKMNAFDASQDVSKGPIWTYSLPRGAVHWSWPLVVNGKVYVPGGDAKIYVFGLK